MSTASSITRGSAAGWTDQNAYTTRSPSPLWLLAELTCRWPLHCAFCYNPADFARQNAELGTDMWCDVITLAREMGPARPHRGVTLAPRRLSSDAASENRDADSKGLFH
jgi:hypothetical protein